MKAWRFLLFLAAALAAALAAPGAVTCLASGLGLSGPMNRMVTPNGDGMNDYFTFRCYNPQDLDVEGTIYDLSGRQVAGMTLAQRDNGDPSNPDNVAGVYYDMRWDPNSGRKAAGGVYVYQVTVGTKVYKGTLVVIR